MSSPESTAASAATTQNPVSEAPPAPTPAPVNLPPDPSELARQAAQEIPILAQLEEPLEVIFVCYTQYVGDRKEKPTRDDVAAALEEMQIAQVGNAKTIQLAIQVVNGALKDHWQEINDRFIAATHDTVVGPSHPLGSADLMRRLTDEQNEQQDFIRKSHELKQLVITVRNKLGIQIVAVTPSENPAQTVQKDIPDGGLLHGLRKVGGFLSSAVGSFDSVPDIGSVHDAAQPPFIPPSPVKESPWIENSVWTDDDPSVKKFKVIVARKAMETDDPNIAWSKINGLKISREDATKLLADVESLADRQVQQSERIMQEVGQSYGDFKHEIEVIQRIGGVVDAVASFFSVR